MPDPREENAHCKINFLTGILNCEIGYGQNKKNSMPGFRYLTYPTCVCLLTINIL